MSINDIQVVLAFPDGHNQPCLLTLQEKRTQWRRRCRAIHVKGKVVKSLWWGYTVPIYRVNVIFSWLKLFSHKRTVAVKKKIIIIITLLLSRLAEDDVVKDEYVYLYMYMYMFWKLFCICLKVISFPFNNKYYVCSQVAYVIIN